MESGKTSKEKKKNSRNSGKGVLTLGQDTAEGVVDGGGARPWKKGFFFST